MNINDIKRDVKTRGYSFCSMCIATEDDAINGSLYQYCPACHEGDRLVTMIGRDRGSVEWTENYGQQ